MQLSDIQNLNAIDFNGLNRFLKTCRKQGVTDVTIDGMVLKFGDLPTKHKDADDSDEILSDGPTNLLRC